MKSYIFFTDEGYTKDSNNKEISNMQILGSADGKDTLEAFKNFKEDLITKKIDNINHDI